MTVIYNNVPANTATVYDYTITGCENQILFRATQWGSTQVQVESYSVSDPSQKTAFEFTAVNNSDWCLSCPSVGEVYRFTVLTPDPTTDDLFVEILDKDCCCPSSSSDCIEIPIKFVNCP